MKSCFGYIRVSTQKQGEGVSLEAQKDAILAYAERQGLSVCRWFEEKETAAKSGRRVFNQMLKLLQKRAAAGLIMHRIDRSARNLRDWAAISELSDAGVDVYFATETLDFRSRGGRLTADIQAVIAADYIRNLREETCKGLEGRLKQGLYPFKAPLGYLDNGRGKPKTPCPVKAPLIRRAFGLYATGQHSYRSLLPLLGKEGLTNQRGKPLTLHGLESILRNPFYCGLIEVRRSGRTYKGCHQPLIQASLYRSVEAVRAGKSGKKVTRHNHLYRGLFRCALCDAAMTPERQKGRTYYRCQRQVCPTTTIREDVLEAAIEAALRSVELTDAVAKRLLSDWQQWYDGNQQRSDAESLQLRIAAAEGRSQRLTDLLVDGLICEEEYQSRRKAATLELASLNEEWRKLNRNGVSAGKVAKFLELMKNISVLHRLLKPCEKREIVEHLFSNRVVDRKTICIKPLDWLIVHKISDLSPLVTRFDTLIELEMHEGAIKVTWRGKGNEGEGDDDDSLSCEFGGNAT